MSGEMRTSARRLHELLPAIHRLRDEGQGRALGALIDVLAGQAQVVEADIEQLYDDWFIETCQEWVVPYLGKLLGARDLHPIREAAVRSQRAYVANTLAYRRRKGTATMLEQLTLDVTGWPARAVEFFERVATTQHHNHRRPQVQLAGLRDAGRLELVDGPFDPLCHTVDVRHLPAGRHNLPHVGLFVWRLQSYPLKLATARAAAGPPGRFTFDPLGRSRALWNQRRAEVEITHLAAEGEVPGRLRRRVLADDPARLAGAGLRVLADGVPVELRVCNLEALPGVDPEDWPRPSEGLVAVDPELGRLAFAKDQAPARVEVDFCYAFPGDVGGGPYDRRPPETAGADPEASPPVDLLDHPELVAAPRRIPSQHTTVQDALDAAAGQARVVLEFEDSRTYDLPAAMDLKGDVVLQARPGARPVLRGDTIVTCRARSRLVLSGLLIEGAVRIEGELAALELRHTTILPGHDLMLASTVEGLSVRLVRSICGRISLPPVAASLAVEESIIDPIDDADAAGEAADGGADLSTRSLAARAISAPQASVRLERSTVLGAVTAQHLEASDCLLLGPVSVTRRQVGCLRFSWVAPGSTTPRRYRCQPDLGTAGLGGRARARAELRLAPRFTALRFDDPAYSQLAEACPEPIRTGASDGSEMGVWSFLQQPQREANLRRALDEYLRFGLEAGLIHVT